MTNYACHEHHLNSFAVHYLTEGSCEISASFLKEYLNKGRKIAKKRINYA